MFKFDLGDEVKEKITGFSGIIVARIDYLTGCNRYSVQSKKLNDGKPIDWQNFDEDMLERESSKKIKIETDRSKGGIKPAITRNYK